MESSADVLAPRRIHCRFAGAVVAAGLLLAACGGRGSETATEDTASTAKTTTTAPTTTVPESQQERVNNLLGRQAEALATNLEALMDERDIEGEVDGAATRYELVTNSDREFTIQTVRDEDGALEAVSVDAPFLDWSYARSGHWWSVHFDDPGDLTFERHAQDGMTPPGSFNVPDLPSGYWPGVRADANTAQ
jgi:hypothetical protein